jgi:subtilisin family serine protease
MKNRVFLNNNHRRTAFLISSIALFSLAGCGGGGSDSPGGSGSSPLALTEVDASDLVTKQEVDRLRYFREINADQARSEFNVTGSGVRVTIMGEMVDVSHPDIQNSVVYQYNTFSNKSIVNMGTGNHAYRIEDYGRDDGHGTHIAGTIAAACDGIGIQGVACDATLDVYDIGAYGNEQVPQEGWGDAHEFERLIESFSAALNDVTQRQVSRILTGSFNIESPAILYQAGGSLEGQSITSIINRFEQEIDEVSDLSDKGLVSFQNNADIEYLNRVVNDNGEDPIIAIGTLLPQSSQWKVLEDAIQAYQATDGVYIVTESNNLFENRTSVLNAMPSLSDKVDPDLWISAVLAQPKNYEAVISNPNVTEADVTALMDGEYITPINSCGVMASEYCILIPSYDVLSTMTRKVAQQALPLYLLEERNYQVFTGHSMGAPMIAGALALMEEYNQHNNFGYSMKDLVRLLKENANRSFTGYNASAHGRGLLDISAALSAM